MSLNSRLAHASFLLMLMSNFALSATTDVLHGVGNVDDGGASTSVPGAYPVVLQNLRGINFGGPTLPYDFAYSGASSSSVLLPGDADAQLVTQIQAGNVTLAYMSIGANDMLGAVASVANSSLSGPALIAQENVLINNIETGVNMALGAGAKVVLGGLTDVAESPSVASLVADPAAKARVEGAIANMESQLAAFAATKGIPFVDFFALEKAVYDSGHLQIGGVNISLTTFGPDPHNFFQDSLHAGIAIEGEVANLWLQGTNTAYGTNIPLLTDQEILNLAGIGNEYQAETFLAAEPLAQFTDFTALPEPSSLVLLGVGAVGLLGLHARRRVDRRNVLPGVAPGGRWGSYVSLVRCRKASPCAQHVPVDSTSSGLRTTWTEHGKDVAVHFLTLALREFGGLCINRGWTSSNSRRVFARGGSTAIGWWS